ncbi:hypothetical protein N7527_003963 [Penicillium freii]|nr:hypothetical protein N7527_003963 [Penicillium freii]
MVSVDLISKYLHHLNCNAERNHVTSGVTRPIGQRGWCLELESHYHDLEQGTGNLRTVFSFTTLPNKPTHCPTHIATMSDHPIPAPSDHQAELLTQLRGAARTQSYACQRILREASEIMESLDLIIYWSTNGGITPSADILCTMEQRMMSLVEEMRVAREAGRFYRGLEAEIFRNIG